MLVRDIVVPQMRSTHPRVSDPVVELNLSCRRLSLEVGRNATKAEGRHVRGMLVGEGDSDLWDESFPQPLRGLQRPECAQITQSWYELDFSRMGHGTTLV